MTYAVSFIILLGILVFVHELGHFLMGKLSGVRVETFSLGFGKAILKKKIGETEYRISLFPLGGYVKFYGDEGEIDPALKKFTFMAQSISKRMLIVLAGPVFNFFLAIFLFGLIFIIGEPNVAPVFGYVEYESPAWISGLRQNDEVTQVNGIATQTWNDFDDNISGLSVNSASITVNRLGNLYKFEVPLTLLMGRDKFGQMKEMLQIEGVTPYKRSTLIGISEESSVAYKAGFRTGDLILSLNGKEIESWTELEDFLMSNFGVIAFKVKRLEDELIINFDNKPSYSKIDERLYKIESTQLLDNYNGVANNIGFYPAETFVKGYTSDDSPAAKAGFMIGDRIVAINNVFIRSNKSLQNIAQKAGFSGKELKVLLERNGKLILADVSPSLQDVEMKAIGHKEQRFLLGVQTYFSMGSVEKKEIVIRNPIKLVVESLSKTAMWMWITLVGFFKLLTGSISLKVLGGPLMLGKIAGDSLSLGLVYFFKMMAIISINLGLINLFPIPVLDGGHLFFYTLEAIMRKPIKEKYMEIAQQVGFFLLIALMFVAFYNDILRYGSGILGLFKL